MGIDRITLPEPATDLLGGLPGAEGAAEQLPAVREDARDPLVLSASGRIGSQHP